MRTFPTNRFPYTQTSTVETLTRFRTSSLDKSFPWDFCEQFFPRPLCHSRSAIQCRLFCLIHNFFGLIAVYAWNHESFCCKSWKSYFPRKQELFRLRAIKWRNNLFNSQRSLGAKIAQLFDERFPRLFRPDLEVGFFYNFSVRFSPSNTMLKWEKAQCCLFYTN